MWHDADEESFALKEEEVVSVMWMDLDECIEGFRANTFENCIAPEKLEIDRRTAYDQSIGRS